MEPDIYQKLGQEKENVCKNRIHCLSALCNLLPITDYAVLQGPEPGDDMPHGLDTGGTERLVIRILSIESGSMFFNGSRSVPYSNPGDPEQNF